MILVTKQAGAGGKGKVAESLLSITP
uniref:Uncharacterized protein n=1 Tax=Arundo donax TaxID=35708 RepID=A0A0A8ZSH0_ARUDO